MKFKDRTRGGLEYKIYEENVDTGTKYTIFGSVKKYNGKWQFKSWTSTGTFILDEEHEYDLIPEQEEMWANIYPDGDMVSHVSWEKARSNADSSCIATVKVTYHHGQGLGREE